MVTTRIRKVLIAAALAGAVLGSVSGQAAAATHWQPCDVVIEQFECATFSMPLDRTGAIPGTTNVRAILAPAAEGPRMGTLFVLAGGPGQSSDVMIGLIYDLFEGANRYDIVAVDQRGSGASEPLNCPRLQSGNFNWNGADPSTDGPITDCSNSLGPARAAYNTAEAVEDLEAVRADLGVPNATFFGISYGTKVALAYAKAYPSHTKALLIDSVLPTDMPSAFDTDSLEALRQVLPRLCGGKRCRGIGGDPTSGVFKLAKRLVRKPIDGFIVTPDGIPLPLKLDAVALYDAVFGADMNPFIYSQLPSAVSSALAGRDASLLRLYSVATGAAGASTTRNGAQRIATSVRAQLRRTAARKKAANQRGRASGDVASFSTTMFFATTCADFAPPWTRGDDLTGRQGAIDDLANRTPSTAFYPFPRATAAADSTAAYCRGWQQSPLQPAVDQGPLPDIPTLALTGTLDLRTPSSWASKATAGDPQAQIVPIPNVGHSAIGMDMSGCALSLAKRFLIYGATDGKCKRTSPAIPIAPKPTNSINSVRAARGSCTRISRPRCKRVLKVLTGGYLGLRDVLDQMLIGGSQSGPGLYDGFWMLDYNLDNIFVSEPTELSLSGISAVPGVYASGTVSTDLFPLIGGDLRISGYRVSVSGRVAYDRSGDSLTISARRGRTRVRVTIRPRSRAASTVAPSRSAIGLRRSMALAVGPTGIR